MFHCILNCYAHAKSPIIAAAAAVTVQLCVLSLSIEPHLFIYILNCSQSVRPCIVLLDILVPALCGL